MVNKFYDLKDGQLQLSEVRSLNACEHRFLLERARDACTLNDRAKASMHEAIELVDARQTLILVWETSGLLGAAWTYHASEPLPSADPMTPELVIGLIPSVRSTGLSDMLLAKLLESTGRQTVVANIHQAHGALSLYQRHGFVVSGPGRGPKGIELTRSVSGPGVGPKGGA